MDITLSPEQQKNLEEQVAAGRFASIEEAVRFAVGYFMPPDHADLSWVKPYLEEGRASLTQGGGITLDTFNAHVKKRLSELDG